MQVGVSSHDYPQQTRLQPDEVFGVGQKWLYHVAVPNNHCKCNENNGQKKIWTTFADASVIPATIISAFAIANYFHYKAFQYFYFSCTTVNML